MNVKKFPHPLFAVTARVKVVVASFMQPAFEYRYQSNAS